MRSRRNRNVREATQTLRFWFVFFTLARYCHTPAAGWKRAPQRGGVSGRVVRGTPCNRWWTVGRRAGGEGSVLLCGCEFTLG